MGNLDLKGSSHPPTTLVDSDSGLLIFTFPPGPSLVHPAYPLKC